MKNLYIDIKSQSSGGGTVISDEWVRPDDWLALPVLAEGDQKFVGLHAVYGDSDFVSVLCAGAYTVDWGDGTVEDVAANTKKDHLFSYAALAGTESSRGYRQAIVTITPQAGQLLTKIDLQQKHSQAGLSNYYGQWLEISMVGASITYLVCGGTTIYQGLLEQFRYIGNNQLTAADNLFLNCQVLESVSINTSQCTSFRGMFQGNYRLKHGPALDTSNALDMYAMFSTNTSLKSIPLYDTSKVTNFNSMFQNCYSLEYIPSLDTSSGTIFINMFYACYSLLTIPLLDLTNASSTGSMLYNCRSLQVIPDINIPNITNNTGMLQNCYCLQRARLQSVSKTISLSGCKLSAAELEQLFTSLANVTSQTLTITGNWGAAYLTDTQKAIATNKGWTLVL